MFHLIMDWSLWFVCVSVCVCWPLPDSAPYPPPSSPLQGEVSSPLYPHPYPPNLQQQWELRVPEGFKLRLLLTHLDLEASEDCYYDSLTVLYGDTLLGRFCGNLTSDSHPGLQPIISPGNSLKLRLQTDDGNPEGPNLGFTAHYQAIDVDECASPLHLLSAPPLCSQICLNTLGSYLCSCYHGYQLRSDQRSCVLSCGSGVFEEPEGHLLSPGFPAPPPDALSCHYVITVQSGFTVSLNFSQDFHIESSDWGEGPQCLYHWLEVLIPDQDPVRLCGSTSPGLIQTRSNTVRLEYHTDGRGLSRGWSLDYTTHRVRCPSPGSVVQGRLSPRQTDFFYRDHVYVRCDPGYKLMADGQEIHSFSSMCQNNGQWHRPLPECHIIDCGDPEPLLNGHITFLSGLQNQYQSVVQYHCNQPFYSMVGGTNMTFVCEEDRKWRSSDDDVIGSPSCIPVCGRPTREISTYRRVMGGNVAPDGTIPWQVLLHAGGRGGGIVVGGRWIMTAAHNLVRYGQEVPRDKVKVYLGVTNAASQSLSPVSVSSLHLHPDYNVSDDNDNDNDIALLRLEEELHFNASVLPVCLPAQGDTYQTGARGLVSGFGFTGSSNNLTMNNRLNFLRLPLVSQESCGESLRQLRHSRPDLPRLTHNMFCAGLPEGGPDACQGDSGGPFTLTRDHRVWVAGIVSWGAYCGHEGRYGVYTRVGNYVDWIKKTMQEN